MGRVLAIFCIPFCLFGIASCGTGGDQKELSEYIKQVKSKPSGAIEPLPTFTPYESFTYGASVKRSPFDRPVDLVHRVYGRKGVDVKPDLNREKEYLERYDLGELEMVGTIKKGGTLWALVSDPTGFVTTVTEGNYLGKNYGKIVTANNTQIELLEIVSDGLDGWVERPRILAVTEKD